MTEPYDVWTWRIGAEIEVPGFPKLRTRLSDDIGVIWIDDADGWRKVVPSGPIDDWASIAGIGLDVRAVIDRPELQLRVSSVARPTSVQTVRHDHVLGSTVYLAESQTLYAVAGVWTKADGTADVHLVELEAFNDRRRTTGLPEIRPRTYTIDLNVEIAKMHAEIRAAERKRIAELLRQRSYEGGEDWPLWAADAVGEMPDVDSDPA